MYYDELREKVPASLRQLLQIPGIGAKTAQIIYQNLKPRDLAELETAAREKRLRELPGIGSKTEEAILRGLETLASSKKRLLLHYAFAVAGEIKDYLKSLSGIKEANIAGSLRRGMETVGDLDFVAVAHDPLAVIKELATAPFLQELLTADNFQLSLMTKWGIRADILVVQPEYYATALQYMTGSKEHNEELSALASSLGWESSENGIYPGHGEPLPSSEEELYSRLGMLYIPPELREGRGEIQAASKGVLPYLLEVYDLKGDLHVHSHWSDGVNTLEELALEARRRGYQYLAVTDHSKSLHVARGLTEERIWEQREEIHRINQRLSDFRLLAGIEVEIRPDGSLDFDDVIFTGWVENPLQYMKGFDLLVLPSLHEACPLVILESLYVGTPVIASKVGGIPEILKYDELLVEPGNVQVLTEKILNLMKNEKDYNKSVELCNERIKKFIFNWDEVMINMLRNIT